MPRIKYSIEKHTTVEFIVMAQVEDEMAKTPVAKCDTEAVALTIKGMYEESETK